VLLLARPSALKGDPLMNFTSLKKLARAPEARLKLRTILTGGAFAGIPKPDIIVDAIFGIGFSGKVNGLQEKAVEWINWQRAFVAAVDIPSGVNATTGEVGNISVRADLTVTMASAKIGHYVGSGRESSGEVAVVDISIPLFSGIPRKDPTFRVTRADVAAALPSRPLTAHKYSVGKVLMIAGSRNFTGAAYMSAQSAMRSGVGAVVLGLPVSIHQLMAKKLTEVILLPLPETSSGTIARSAVGQIRERLSWADTVVIGPGLSRNDETDSLVLELLSSLDRPVVLDADGLNAVATDTAVLRRRRAPTVLTPHAGELSRLTGESAAEIERIRIEAAREAAARFGCVVVLKGAPTVTADRTGGVYVNPTGNPGMATIGSGDMLTGLLAGLMAQGMQGAPAAWCAVYLHGRAGDLAAAQLGQRSLLALDILHSIPAAIMDTEGRVARSSD
jgi:NAD(P)H-hydrate epimerase